jgi:hypothetical protein
MLQALEDFFGDASDNSPEAQLFVTEWMIHDWIVPSLRRTVLDQFLARRGARLTARELEAATAWSRSFFALYEVLDVKSGIGVALKEVFSGETVFVHDINLSRRAARWDGLLTRVVPGERGLELAGIVMMVPRVQLERLSDWMEDDRERLGLAWPEYMKANWPRIRRQTADLADEWLDELRLTNNSGEELLFSKAWYRVSDQAKVIEALRSSSEFSEDEQSPMKFVWLSSGNTVLGTVRITDGEMVFESGSKQRHERGSRLISILAGPHVCHLRDEFTTQQELKRRLRESPEEEPDAAADSGSELPAKARNEILAQLGEQHYVQWLDQRIPALAGKTPRQAAKTAQGRRQLEELLKYFENTEDRKRRKGEPFIEMARVRADPGID